MNFNSLEFLVFFALILSAYFYIPQRFRWFVLLLASYWFYAQWHAGYLLLIAYSTACSYAGGLALAGVRPASRKWVLGLSLLLVFIPMFVFKYMIFLADSFNNVSTFAGKAWTVPVPDLLLPVGISFFTFQAAAYLVDVYRVPRGVERHAGMYALYIAFFPQLVAGPIERAFHILPQLHAVTTFCSLRVSSGLRLVLWGLFKKMVIADRIANLIDPVFAKPETGDGVLFVFSAFAFGVQIYCDFSAYSDIAVGTSRTLGISLMRNFNNPVLATSMSDFWSRWHISLSTWFRDYLYFPMGGSRGMAVQWIRNILVVFLVSGLWHGANWTFVVWGAAHGIVLVTERLLSRAASGAVARCVPRTLKRVITLSLACLLWLPFRASSLADAWYMLTHLHTGWLPRIMLAWRESSPWALLGMDVAQLQIAGVATVVLFVVECLVLPSGKFSFGRLPKGIRWCCYLALVWVILGFGVHDAKNAFIYFQF